MFRKQLLDAAEQSFRDNEITRRDLLRIRLASLSPVLLQKIQQTVEEQIEFEGSVNKAESIDWIALIKELLPIILQLLVLLA